MDLNNFDDINDISSDEDPIFDLNKTTQNSYIPTFSELLSDSQYSQKVDIFGTPMSLSQLSTQDFVQNTPFYCASKSNISSSSQKNQPNTTIIEDNCASKSNKPSSPKSQSTTTKIEKWNEKEDEALMSNWCICSEDPILGKNQNNKVRWNKVLELYEQSRLENNSHHEFRPRTIQAMKSRWKRLNLNVNKWVGCYSKVTSRPPASGTNIEDDIEAAQKLYRLEREGKTFEDFNVYENVMSKHHKWSLPMKGVNVEVSGSSSKRTRSDMDSSPHSVNFPTSSSVNVDTPTSVEDINNRPEGREAAKRRKGKTTTTPTTTTESTFNEQDKSLIEGMSSDNKAQIQLRQKRIEADLHIAQLGRENIEMTRGNIKMKSDMKILNTLLARQNLNAFDEDMKMRLIQKYMSDL